MTTTTRTGCPALPVRDAPRHYTGVYGVVSPGFARFEVGWTHVRASWTDSTPRSPTLTEDLVDHAETVGGRRLVSGAGRVVQGGVDPVW